ncbi:MULTISPECIES: hypothetical protein [Flavobacterium]|uniref:Lipoprotein n=1 Tax=Flavobacterium jumunjinense TaxID=998845 RepID=A0ABV5GIK6_9FLAO|nr:MULTISPECIES: hypothetical protein [Flavobacterium]
MKKNLFLFAFVILLFSCKKTEIRPIETTKKLKEKGLPKRESSQSFDYSKFTISKGKMGTLKIGMTCHEADKLLSDLTKKETDPFNFGFDGGGKAYIYYFEEEPILSLIPEFETDTIIAIIALTKEITTKNGLHPNASVSEILQKIPKLKVNYNPMMDWEYMTDENNNWDFIFATDPNHQIGNYTAIEEPTKPIRLEIKCDWITIH